MANRTLSKAQHKQQRRQKRICYRRQGLDSAAGTFTSPGCITPEGLRKIRNLGVSSTVVRPCWRSGTSETPRFYKLSRFCRPRSPSRKHDSWPVWVDSTYQPKPGSLSPLITLLSVPTFPENLRHCVVPLPRPNVLRVHFAIDAPDRKHLQGKAVTVSRTCRQMTAIRFVSDQ